MNFREPIQIRLEVERMQMSILQALDTYHGDLKQHIETRVKDFIDSGKFTQSLSQAIETCVQDEMNNYFKYGSGRRAIIQLVDGAFSTLKEGK